MVLIGKMVKLRPLLPQDLPLIVASARDPQIQRLVDGAYPSSLAECAPWFNALKANRNHKHFAIIAPDNRFIGDIELDSISWRRREGELRICICNPNYWNRGLGTDAVATLAAYAFDQLHLRLIYLRVYRENRRAIRCYEKVGFRIVGWLRRPTEAGIREVYLMCLTPAELQTPLPALAG
ncbi:MAG: GNAT family N-acetyltransferase [Limnochordales bacterium]|nr:GNAT family N-acetyltransferase [Limnochordales bacterium]